VSHNFTEELDMVFKAIFECHPLGAIMYSREGKVVHVNGNAVDLYGQHVPLGSTMEHAVMAAGRRQPDMLAKAQRGEPVRLAPYELAPPTGFMHDDVEPRWIREMYNPVFHHSTGDLMGVVALLEDCSQEVVISTALSRAREVTETLADLLPLVVVLMDQQQIIQYVNELCRTMTGKTNEELIGQNFISSLIVTGPSNRRSPRIRGHSPPNSRRFFRDHAMAGPQGARPDDGPDAGHAGGPVRRQSP
jgi:PAS domain-containing protein